MKTYLVGGAVRDQLLNIPVKDRDWVITGASPQDLLDAGYQQVGADFPVFLHPATKEEYALARTERKSGHGYQGFQVTFDKSVTLEDDLARRDLTINAIALDAEDQIIDPFGGVEDLKSKTLRHVSESFREDPLRVLRIARFAAKFYQQGFNIADETKFLLIEMSKSGELEHLVAERIWTETEKALITAQPSQYFLVLRQVKALEVIFPELDNLFGVPQPMRWHPEIDTGIHTMKAMDRARELSDNANTVFAAACHDLGKGLTDPSTWPSHHGHESAGGDLISSISAQRKWPNKTKALCEMVARYHTHVHKIETLKAGTVLKLLKNLSAFKQPDNVEQFAIACQADAQGRSGMENIEYVQKERLFEVLKACAPINAAPFVAKGLTGKSIGHAIDQARIEAIKAIQSRWS